MILVIVTLLQFRGFDVGALAGFFRISFFRTLGTGAILLFFAYPLIGLSEAINQRFFGGGSSKQSIVEFFSGSRTIEERIMIIVFAVAIAPVAEEFVFRFFIYGVVKRYFGCLVGGMQFGSQFPHVFASVVQIDNLNGSREMLLRDAPVVVLAVGQDHSGGVRGSSLADKLPY